MGRRNRFSGWWRVFRRGAAVRAAAWLALAVLTVPGAALGIVNPHDTTKPKYCLNCHTEEIYAKDCNESEGWCLLGGSVDTLCLTCHVKEECCKPGLSHLPKLYLGLHSHPT